MGVYESKTEHFLDTLLASQQKLLNFGWRADLQRKKDRHAPGLRFNRWRELYMLVKLDVFQGATTAVWPLPLIQQACKSFGEYWPIPKARAHYSKLG